MKNSKLRRALLLAACAVMLVCLSVGATLAYMTDNKTVTNTFTVGNVKIDLKEGDVFGADDDDYTAELNGQWREDYETNRVTENKYKLVPGREYDKDPIITIDSNSENCYVFVQIQNDIADIEDENATIADQMTEKFGWKQLTTPAGENIEGFYYQEAAKKAGDKITVFEHFTITGDGIDNTTLESYKDKTIVVKAYAIQKDGFDSAIDAWDAANGEMKKIGE